MNDKELISLKSTVKEFCDGIMEESSSDDMCYIVCIALMPYLEFIGHKGNILFGNFDIPDDFIAKLDSERKALILEQDGFVNHYWIELDNGILIDPTADQLERLYGLPNMPMNYVGKKPDWYPQEQEA